MLRALFSKSQRFKRGSGSYLKWRTIFSFTKLQQQKQFPESNDILCTSEIDDKDREYQELSSRFFGVEKAYNCYIIHPYIKWGPKKQILTTPEDQLEEAESLIRTLDPWTVEGKVVVPLTSLDKKTIFGSGNLEKLRNTIRSSKATAVFMNMSTLKIMQIEELESQFGVPIFDRYKIVIEILRLHAISKHAKLQVALAEIPYITNRLTQKDIACSNPEKRKLMLHSREQKLKAAIKKLRTQHEMTRNRRKSLEFPSVAVVGYTNCGKTSLIKALSNDKDLQPRNQLFATLDVTMHAGLLPSTLEVLYVDTVGFISDIPTTLIECFIATLEDALFATVILHVEDISSKKRKHQRNHVLQTLENLLGKSLWKDKLNKIITVGNKCDLVEEIDNESGLIPVSAKTGQGLDKLLKVLEDAVLKESNRRLLTIKIPFGGEEIRWLYKNATVKTEEENPDDSQYENATVIISEAKYHQFQKQFCNHR
ncbi:putative GTP-binding protein 6 [Agrilus planipennis]|uniref:GTP-binding protein 6 n=1 Tax=Agrilus planipennis TaxID=224129 RepID=A0A1W4WWK4_AGRPL|nr:putative GTP-binding protein 6 [Agrilus planipennis]